MKIRTPFAGTWARVSIILTLCGCEISDEALPGTGQAAPKVVAKSSAAQPIAMPDQTPVANALASNPAANRSPAPVGNARLVQSPVAVNIASPPATTSNGPASLQIAPPPAFAANPPPLDTSVPPQVVARPSRFASATLMTPTARASLGELSTPQTRMNPTAATPGLLADTASAMPITTPLGNLQFVEGYQAGLQASRQQGKPMLLFFTAQWCRYCHQMANETFVDPQVVALGQQFICVQIDADAESEVCNSFQVKSYPTLQLVSPQGQPVGRLVGKHSSREVAAQMYAALPTSPRGTGGEIIAQAPGQ